MPSSPALDGKVAIVTGGSRGIGAAIVSHLLAGGARVMFTGLQPGRLDAARERFATRHAGVSAHLHALAVDVRKSEDVARLMNQTVERFGGLDILVNNAGVGVFSEAANLTDEQWADVIGTNLSGVFYCCRAALPHLRRRGGGWIINISSLAGKNAFAGGAAYCASKAGLNAFSEALMQEVRYDNIRVSYVMPGSVRTGFSGLEDGEGTDWKLSPDDVAQVVIDLVEHDRRSLPSRVEIRPSKPRK